MLGSSNFGNTQKRYLQPVGDSVSRPEIGLQIINKKCKLMLGLKIKKNVEKICLTDDEKRII
ncbi:MAG: hypothetical protein LBI45_04070, partial [Bacteroidales bacterium]|nr:hypothetical protein [Bacteroidales bacterium]